MSYYFTQKRVLVYIKFVITLILLLSVKDLSTIDSFTKLAIVLLEFIIILELVRMLIEFLFSDENRINLRLMIDSTIVFFIRDIMLIVNNEFQITKVMSLLGVVGILFIFRILSMKYSPAKMEK